MTRAERADFVHRRLAELYPETPIPLDHQDAFTLLVAVLLSAQCTDERVNKVTPALFALADTPAKMRRVPVEQIEEAIRPCGLAPRKARAISELSRLLVEQHGGELQLADAADEPRGLDGAQITVRLPRPAGRAQIGTAKSSEDEDIKAGEAA